MRATIMSACAIALMTGAPCAHAAIIYASGQNNGDPTHNSGNYYYAIDTSTGLATPISPLLSGGSAAGLAGTNDNRLLGFSGGTVGEVNPFTGTFTPGGVTNGLSVTGLDIYNGSGYGVPTTGTDRRLHRFDLTDSSATATNTIAVVLSTFFFRTMPP